MADRAQIAHSRLAVITIASLAAVCGIYTICHAYAAHPGSGKTSLQRSNAIHRPRPDRSRPHVELTAATPEAPLGVLTIRRGRHVLTANLAHEMPPESQAIEDAIGPISDEAFQEIQHATIYSILVAASQLHTPDMRQSLTATPFANLPEAIDRGDEVLFGVLSEALKICMPNVYPELVDDAVKKFQSDIHTRRFEANDADSTSSDSANGALAETDELDGLNGAPPEPSQGIKGLLYYIAESQAKRQAYEHRGISCEECNESPIRGVRYHCLNCPDFDLCENCEPHTQHIKTHVLAKIRIPLPVLSQPSRQFSLWYPGDPRKIHRPLDPAVRKQLAHRYGFEEPIIDAHFDQFTCISNVPWQPDDTKVHAAIDKRAFAKALTPERWPQRFAPNVLYDRIFAFYDTDCNGLIGLEEFVSGMAYLRGPKRFSSLQRALSGYDIDGDGFVDRSDFLRLFRAKYILNQQLVSDMIEGQEQEQTRAGMDVLRSSQPISSTFNQEDIPRGESRPSRGKRQNADGDMQPMPGVKTILDDNDPWSETPAMNRHGRLARSASSRERLRHHLSRFEEMLYSPTSHSQHSHANVNQTRDSAAHANGPFNSSSDGNVPHEEHLDPEATQDILLHIAEDGLNEILDSMLKLREVRDQEAIGTRGERQNWKAEIDQARKEKAAFEQEMRKAANIDPLMATAMESYGNAHVRRKSEVQTLEPPFRGEIVPTDSESLAQHEAEIAQKPLAELLQATGYSMLEGDETGFRMDGHSNDTHEPTDSIFNGVEGATEGVRYPQADATHEEARDWLDPTLPQNRPNGATQPIAVGSPPEDREKVPSKDRLEHLASLEDTQREIRDRGGPGRFSLDEIEAMVRSDDTRELRGMVISWLEWASF